MQGNLGDDLMVRVLCERYPQTRFLLYADESYKERYRDLSNVKVYSPTDRISNYIERIIWKVKKKDHGMWRLLVKMADVTVYIGGSIFVQHFDDFRNVHGDLDLARRSKKIYVVGANFGPYTDEKFYEAYKDVFLEYDGVCFRDSYSKELFKEFPHIRYAPDVVFNYPISQDTIEKKQVLFSVISLKERDGKFPLAQYSEEYDQAMVKLAEIFIKKGYQVKFVSFCKFEKDEDVIQRIVSAIPQEYQKKITTVLYEKSNEEVIRAFEESEIIVGTRFHSIILGWLAKKKVLPIVYNKKITNILADNHVSLSINISELPDMTEDGLEKKVEEIIASKAFCPEQLVKEADKQFQDLDCILR